jgi:hypothetical protein
LGVQIKEEQIGVAYGTHEERKMYTELLGIPAEKWALGRLRRRRILKGIFKMRLKNMD